MADQPRLVPLAEGVKHIGRSDKTLRRWLNAGHIKEYRDGVGRIHIDLDELEQFVKPVAKGRAHGADASDADASDADASSEVSAA